MFFLVDVDTTMRSESKSEKQDVIIHMKRKYEDSIDLLLPYQRLRQIHVLSNLMQRMEVLLQVVPCVSLVKTYKANTYQTVL